MVLNNISLVEDEISITLLKREKNYLRVMSTNRVRVLKRMSDTLRRRAGNTFNARQMMTLQQYQQELLFWEELLNACSK